VQGIPRQLIQSPRGGPAWSSSPSAHVPTTLLRPALSTPSSKPHRSQSRSLCCCFPPRAHSCCWSPARCIFGRCASQRSYPPLFRLARPRTGTQVPSLLPCQCSSASRDVALSFYSVRQCLSGVELKPARSQRVPRLAGMRYSTPGWISRMTKSLSVTSSQATGADLLHIRVKV
jgi:hypothetical protein